MKSSTTTRTDSRKKAAKPAAAAKKPTRATPPPSPPVGIQKVYLKTKPQCRITFRLPRVAVQSAKSVCIVGDFNNWSIHADRMRKNKNGDYTITLTLATGREYQFRYFIDESRWENDWNADRYVRSPYGDSDNSVVIV